MKLLVSTAGNNQIMIEWTKDEILPRLNTIEIIEHFFMEMFMYIVVDFKTVIPQINSELDVFHFRHTYCCNAESDVAKQMLLDSLEVRLKEITNAIECCNLLMNIELSESEKI